MKAAKTLIFGIIGVSFLFGTLAGDVSAQSDTPLLPPNLTVLGTGTVENIAYGETVTGSIELSEAGRDIQPISYVGHNGSDRRLGDFDVWYFDEGKGESAIVSVTATSGNLVPTLLIVAEVDPSAQFPVQIPSVITLDANEDGDLNAGSCLRTQNVLDSRRVAIVVFHQPDSAQTGSYSLTLIKVADDAELSGGSTTAVCRVGTFAYTRGDYRVNIRSNPGTQYTIKAQMQPGEPYSLFTAAGGEWIQILFWDGDTVDSGYVKHSLVRLAGAWEQQSPQ